VILFNPSGEVTETTISNIAFRFSSDSSSPYITPRTSCGILEGVQRAELLEKGEIIEEVVRVEEVQEAVEVRFPSFLFLGRP
jgi:4-amino-4-deoxychorismate lyase